MNIQITIIRSVLVLGVLSPGTAVLANDDVRVDVVVDLTDAGKKVARPTLDHPAFYLPVTVGYKEQGDFVPGQKAPPPTPEVQHLLAKALFDQGYRVTNNLNAPSLVLVFWWGYIAPPAADSTVNNSVKPTTTGAPDITSMTTIGGAQAAEGDELDAQMRQMLAGNTFGDETNPLDPRKQVILQMLHTPRYYALVSAFDFNSWLKNFQEMKGHQPVIDKPILLWRAHISTELEGHSLGEVLPSLIATAAPLFGRETTAPQLIEAPVAPMGRVIVGTPEVKN